MLRLTREAHGAFTFQTRYHGPNGNFLVIQGYGRTAEDDAWTSSRTCWFPATPRRTQYSDWFDFVNPRVAFTTQDEAERVTKQLSEDPLYEAVFRAQGA